MPVGKRSTLGNRRPSWRSTFPIGRHIGDDEGEHHACEVSASNGEIRVAQLASSPPSTKLTQIQVGVRKAKLGFACPDDYYRVWLAWPGPISPPGRTTNAQPARSCSAAVLSGLVRLQRSVSFRARSRHRKCGSAEACVF